MIGYLGFVRLFDGQHSVELNEISEVYIKQRNGRKTKIKIGLKEVSSNYYGKGKIPVILGHRTTKGRGLVEEQIYGKRYYIKDKLNIPYRKTSWTGVDGTIWKRSTIGKDKGICYTTYHNGRFIEQYFRYSQNGRKAYHFTRNMCELKVVYPSGVLRSEYVGNALIWDKFTAQNGDPCINPQSSGRNDIDAYDYTEYDRRGRIKNQASIKNRQINGKYIKNGVHYFYVNGLAVPDKLYNAKPEEINPREVLRIENAQVRGMMLKKVGLARLVKECNGKLIDKDESTGNELYDFKCKSDRDTEEMDKVERVLKVVCPSTKTEYFLRIPYDEHFATCENARQGTFNEFDIEKGHIKFKRET